MASKCHKPLPLTLLFLVILCRIELIYCCSGSDDQVSTKTCEAGELGGGMIDETKDPKLPKFSWDIANSNMTMGPYLLNVDFHDGKKDVAILMPRSYDNMNYYNGMDTSILSGNLKDEIPTVEVSVNGVPGENTFEVTMHSKNHKGGIYQVTELKTTEIVQDPCIKDVDYDAFHSGTYENSNYAQNSKTGAPKSFTITLSLHYDNTWLKNIGGGNKATAKKKVREIVNLAEPMFRSASWKLGHTITLKELEVGYVDEYLTINNTNPNKGIKEMEKKNDQRATDADNYHYFAWDKGGGISGIAGLGTVCQTTRSPRTAITEWVGSATSSSEKSQCVLTFAHELGHALNMPHDFTTRPGTCRKDSSGNACCNKGTVMDYNQNTVNQWSVCSKEAMNKLNFGTTRCKSKGSGGGSSTTTGSTTTTSTTSTTTGTTSVGNGNPTTTASTTSTTTTSTTTQSTPNCQDDERWAFYCDHRDWFGGCNGRYGSWFRYHCRKSCNTC